jgi:hypothetical protein
MSATLSQIGVPQVHNAGYTGTGILVAVLDDGFNWFTKHEALRDLVVPSQRQRDFVRGLSDVQDTTAAGMNHGTQVLGCMAGQKSGTYVGAAFAADYALARTEVDATETTQEMLYWGMGAEWADSLGADLISSSLAYSPFDNGVGSYTYSDMNGHTPSEPSRRDRRRQGHPGRQRGRRYGGGSAIWRPERRERRQRDPVGAVDRRTSRQLQFTASADGRIKPDVAAGVSVPLVLANGQPQGYTPRWGRRRSRRRRSPGLPPA